MKWSLLLLILTLFCKVSVFACSNSEHELIIQIVPDDYPFEITWDLVDSSGAVIAFGTLSDTLCLQDSLGCLKFTIYDAASDGICCGYGNGYYNIFWDSTLIKNGGNYQQYEQTYLNCSPGDFCDGPLPIDTFNYSTSKVNQWFVFNPPINGIYEVSTCDTLNTCDTKLWIYETCPSNPTDPTNMQTAFFNDNNTDCGSLAIISGVFDSSQTYLIRVGLASGTCDSIRFSLQYMGPVVGCMDPAACNYLPIAEQAGVCYYFPDTLCGYPDLEVDRNYILSTLSMYYATQGDYCEVQEGCMNGYNFRTTLNFATKISNIGNLDYYIGNPYIDSSQFSFDNCHGHPHYEGYAKYSLIDDMGNTLPIGSKTGFCVIDLECNTGIAQYSCYNMGITAGCSDIYDIGVGCQFIDITDVDSGYYTLRVEVNWDHSPDKLGRYERTYDNNAAEVCIHISIDALGFRSFSLDPTCAPWQDCAGVDHGTAVRDCNGNCNGTDLYGDVNASATQSIDDAHDYLTGILNQSIPTVSCFDLYRDSLISVYDAALMQKCSEHGTASNDLCSFPNGHLIPMSGVELSIGNYNTTDHYFDVYIKNPLNILMGYEFTISGGLITNVKNLLADVNASIEPEFVVDGQKVIALAYTDSFISKNYIPVPLCRVYYSDTSTAACIDSIVHIVSSDAELVNTSIDFSGCPLIINVQKSKVNNQNILLFPNPNQGHFSIGIFLEEEALYLNLEFYNMMEQLVYKERVINNAVSTINLPVKTPGIYRIDIKGQNHQEIRKIVME